MLIHCHVFVFVSLQNDTMKSRDCWYNLFFLYTTYIISVKWLKDVLCIFKIHSYWTKCSSAISFPTISILGKWRTADFELVETRIRWGISIWTGGQHTFSVRQDDKPGFSCPSQHLTITRLQTLICIWWTSHFILLFTKSPRNRRFRTQCTKGFSTAAIFNLCIKNFLIKWKHLKF